MDLIFKFETRHDIIVMEDAIEQRVFGMKLESGLSNADCRSLHVGIGGVILNCRNFLKRAGMQKDILSRDSSGGRCGSARE